MLFLLTISRKLAPNRAEDPDFYEISLRGTWVASNSDAFEGMFVTSLNDRIEYYLDRLWRVTQGTTSTITSTVRRK